jgi:hypothetical protein
LSAGSRKRIAAAGLVIVAALFGWLAYNGGLYRIEITEQEAQERIDAALKQRAADEAKKINIDAVSVRFADDRINIHATVAARFKGQIISAAIEGTGEPIYREGAFYFHPTAPISFTNVGIEKADGGAKSINRLKEKIERFAAEHGLDNVAEAVTAEFGRWASAAAQETLAKAFSLKPIYVLKENTKGLVVKAVLEKVEVVGDRLEISLSLIRLGYAMAASAVCLLLAMVLAFF